MNLYRRRGWGSLAMFVSQGLGGPKGNGKSSYSKGIQVNIPVLHSFDGNVYVVVFDTL